MLQVSDLLKTAIDISTGENSEALEETVSNAAATRFRNDLPPVVVWNVNHTCNMTCPHCYASAKLKPAYDGVSTEEALKIIDKLNRAGIQIIIFSGGEPLMREDLFELITAARGYGISCHLSSNGTLITDDTAGKLKELGITYVGVSIDGLPEFNDTYRGLKDGYKLAWRGIRAAKEAGLQTGVRITVTSKNADQVLPLLDIVSSEGVPRFYVSHLVYGGRGRSYAKNDLDHRAARQSMTALFNKALELIEAGNGPSIVTGGNDADGVFLYLFTKKRLGDKAASAIFELLKKRGGNSAGEKIINIDHKANVHPDQFWQVSNCGNILEEELEEIRSKGLMLELRQREKLLKGKCGSCIYKALCRGSHRERALAAYGDVWREDPACYLNSEETLGLADEESQVSALSGAAR
ncbi:MAG: radical SAM protein [Candidatus Dadabacteria bacterium]|nr:MAG: radical SAM protein [Candidatus Dadabacteria bacterium]